MDVRDVKQVDQVIGQVVYNHGRLDTLVDNVGILKTETILDGGIQDWEEVTRVNLSSVFYYSKAVLPFMIEQRYGKIINIASGSAMKGGAPSAIPCMEQPKQGWSR